MADLTPKQRRMRLARVNWDNVGANPNTGEFRGMRCPECGSFGPFVISARAFCDVLVHDDGSTHGIVSQSEPEWDCDATYYCQEPGCGYENQKHGFEGSGRRAHQPQHRGLIARV